MKMKNSGFSMMELVITIAVIGIFFVSAASVFTILGKGIMNSRTRTVATNLVQEKIESLKNNAYPMLLVTSDSDYSTYGYDNTNYPPDAGILVGDVSYTRKVLVRRVRENDSGKLEEMPAGSGDTGLKKVTVIVSWTENGRQQSYSMSNLFEDPNRKPANGTITGTITEQGTGAKIGGVKVYITDQLNWTDQSDTNGKYSISIQTGTYSIQAYKDGYWPYTSGSISVTGSATQNFTLQKMVTGSVTGYAYINDHAVISEVVASTITVDGENLEWVELYNPTTFSWNMNYFYLYYCDAASVWHYFSSGWADNPPFIHLNTHTATLPPNSYYLIANTGTVVLGSYSVAADASYSQKVFNQDQKGGLWMWVWSGSYYKGDGVGWATSSGSPSTGEWPYLLNGNGLNTGNAHVRYSIPGACIPNKGNAFDSDSNSANFLPNAEISLANDTYPKNSSYSAAPISGSPAYGTVVTCDDGLSSYTTAYMVDPNGNKLAYFSLPNIATGTWTVSLFNGNGSVQQYGNVVLASGGQVVAVPNMNTAAPWPYPGSSNAILASSPSYGMIKGKVVSGGTPLSFIKVESSLGFTYTRDDGTFHLAASPGAVNVTANPGNANPNYISENNSATVVVGTTTDAGMIDISPGGIITGYVKSGSGDNLPGVVFIATDKDGATYSGVSGTDGIYRMADLPVDRNPYTVNPVIDLIQGASPASVSGINVAQGTTVAITTFTITSAYGSISGTVTNNGTSINTGVLLIATTVMLTADPPSFDAALRGGSNYYYGTVSESNGSYAIQVRGGYSYNVYGWYSTIGSNGVPSCAKKAAPSTVTVNQGQTVNGVNISWP